MIHEEKYCPSCRNKFTCMPGNIFHCECSQIKLTEDVNEYLRRNYLDCLCIDCLKKLMDGDTLKKNCT